MYRKPNDIFTLKKYPVIGLLRENDIWVTNLEKDKSKDIHINNDIEIEPSCRFSVSNRLCSMGAFSYTHSELGFGVRVGRYCSIGSHLKIMGADHFVDWISTSPRFYESPYHTFDQGVSDNDRNSRNIVIGNDVWIGANVTLARNVVIGHGAVVATGSVVTKDVPAFSIVGGVPAKVIRDRFSTTLSDKIMSVGWWAYHINDLKGLEANNPEGFLKNLNDRVSDGLIKPYVPPLLTKDDFLRYREPAV